MPKRAAIVDLQAFRRRRTAREAPRPAHRPVARLLPVPLPGCVASVPVWTAA